MTGGIDGRLPDVERALAQCSGMLDDWPEDPVLQSVVNQLRYMRSLCLGHADEGGVQHVNMGTIFARSWGEFDEPLTELVCQLQLDLEKHHAAKE